MKSALIRLAADLEAPVAPDERILRRAALRRRKTDEQRQPQLDHLRLICGDRAVIGYQTFILGPQMKRARALHAHAEAAQVGHAHGRAEAPASDRAAALALSPRVRVDTPALTGSISLKGARVDDLFLKQLPRGRRQDLAAGRAAAARGHGRTPISPRPAGSARTSPACPAPQTVWTQSQRRRARRPATRSR